MSTEANLVEPARQPMVEPGTSFDVTPSDEQKMLVEAVRDFALRSCRPAALSADDDRSVSPSLLATATGLGLTALGVPEAHGGVLEHRSTVTAALVAEALAEGDMGIALACLAPGGVATALGLWAGHSSALPHPQNINFDLAPYESRLVFLSDDQATSELAKKLVPIKTVDLSTDWQLAFENAPGGFIPMRTLSSWSDLPQRQFYSGSSTYRKQFALPGADLRRGYRLTLNFGKGTPIPLPDPLPVSNMRAYLESPVRDAAEVFINDNPAGYVWHPPFQLDITPFVHAGSNQITIIVGNTAINRLAGQPLPDYRLLNARYGVRFIPQDMNNLKPLPSGLLGPITLIVDRVVP